MRNLFAILLIMLLWDSGASANTGVAFVHSGKQTDALNDYWSPEMVDSVRQGLSDKDNYLVVNCDFNQYMWRSGAAGCLADQLYDFVTSRNITDLVVQTHSNAGNVMRWILSNPTWDARYPTIIQRLRWVNALAPSSAGTPLAEVVMQGMRFEASLSWLLGSQTEAVRMQQPSWMGYYNESWLFGTPGRPALPKGFWNVVGTDVKSAIWDRAAHCGGYLNQVGLEFTRNWLDSCSDGFINCDSQNAAGTLWFYDYQMSPERLLHAQIQHECQGLKPGIRDGATYCRGNLDQVALELTRSWHDDCSDGVIDCRSQNGAETRWFSDHPISTNRLSHAQSRQDCHGLGLMLRHDL